MAVRHFCDICKNEFRCAQWDFGTVPILTEWEGHTVEISTRLILPGGGHGELCVECAARVLSDNFLHFLAGDEETPDE